MATPLKLDYEPREPFLPFHNRSQRFGMLVCHRRAGKTVGCIGEVVLRALRNKKKNAQYAYIGPFRQQAKKTAWQYLKEMTMGLTKGPPRESDLEVRLYNNATITIYGADNPDTFRGLYFDGVVLDEFGDCRASLWNQVILPALIDRNGWAVFIGTVKGKNHFYKMWQRAENEDGWFTMMLKASESGILDEKQIALLKQEQSAEAWAQEMECDWEAAVPGTYYSQILSDMEKSKRIGKFHYNPELPVYAAADLGIRDTTAWWFWQVDDGGPIFIDYEEESGQSLSYYFEMLKSKPWKNEVIYLPHDAVAKSLQTGRTTIEQFLAEGFKCQIVPRQKVQHGIDAARYLLPYCRFDEANCFSGIEALRAYRRKFDDKMQTYSDQPVHDWASNGADAFRYAALVSELEFTAPEQEVEVEQTGYTLDQLWQDRQDDQWRTRIIRI